MVAPRPPGMPEPLAVQARISPSFMLGSDCLDWAASGQDGIR